MRKCAGVFWVCLCVEQLLARLRSLNFPPHDFVAAKIISLFAFLRPLHSSQFHQILHICIREKLRIFIDETFGNFFPGRRRRHFEIFFPIHSHSDETHFYRFF